MNYIFKVTIRGVGRRFWREIKISNLSSVAELGYVIMITLTDCEHLFTIEYNKITYFSWPRYNEGGWYEEHNTAAAKDVILEELSLKLKDKLIMNYDMGCDWYFDITLVRIDNASNILKEPIILDGKGSRIIENIPPWDFKDLLYEIDNNKLTEEHIELLEWNPSWIEDDFDLEEHNEDLIGIRIIKKNLESIS